jgi:hypothetical protein
MKSTLTLLTALLLAMLSALHAAAPLMTGNLFDASALMPEPQQESFLTPQGKAEWMFAEPVNKITPVSVGAMSVAEGHLQFTLGKEGALIGWGNYEGKQPHRERVNLWDGPMTVTVTMKASAAVEATFLPWCDGEAGGKVPESKTVRSANRKRAKPAGVSAKVTASAEWQTVSFKTDSMKHSDGFELEFAGAEGSTVMLKSVRFDREMHAGWWRKEFTLPPGKIWRAVAEVGMMCSLAVNGQAVPSVNGMRIRPSFNFANGEMFDCEALDLLPLLKPGANAIAVHAARNGAAPYVTFNLTVVMESGEIVRVMSDGSWKHGAKEPLEAAAKVSRAGFDESAWAAATARKGASLNYKAPTSRPAYAGLMMIENAAEPYLFYRDTTPVEFTVKTPPGLNDTQIEWRVQQFQDGKFADGTSGVTKESRIKAGTLPRGVYLLHATLKRGNDVLEERIPEPFVITGKVPMREVAGDTITEGLDLTLEAEIDYTKPDGAIPWQETTGLKDGLITKATITERNGLRYRETGTERGALISHRYNFKHPGDFYLMELEFPDDAERWFGVSCTSSMAPHTSKDGPATWTGQKYPLTGKMKTMQWIHRPDPGATAITLSNLQRDTTAAASRLRIQHIKNGLPALKFSDPGARMIGQYTERTSSMGGFGKTFGFHTEPQQETKMGQTTRDNDPVLMMCRELAYNLDAAEHYAQWLRFTGQNLHVMGCLQYFESNTAFTAPGGVNDSRCLPDLHDVAMRVFGENGIQVIASLEYVCHQSFIREFAVNDGEVALGADTVYLVNKDGKQPWNWLGRYGMHFLHPRIEANMIQIARDLQRKFAGQPNFLGVNYTPFAGGDWLPSFTTQGWRDPLDSSFDDITAARFTADTGVKLPGAAKDPQRFAQRAEFLLAPAMKERWLQWRCEKTRDFFTKMQRELNAKHNFISLYVAHTQEMQTSGMTPRDYLRQFGWSPEVYQNQPGLWFPKWTHATQRYASMVKIPRNENWPGAWDMSVGSDYNRTFEQPTNRASFVMTHWQEHEEFAETLEARDGWPRPFQMTYQALPNGDNAREVFTQNLLTTDPEMVMWGFCDLVIQTGHEQPLREFARVLRSLPKAKLMPALDTSLQTNLVLREVRDAGKLWFIAANPGYWPLTAEVYVTGANGIRDAASGAIATESAANGNTILKLALKPYEVRAFVVDAPAAKLHGWKSQPVAAADLAHIHTVLAEAETLLANKSRAARLLPEERDFTTKQIAEIKAALEVQQIAKAWSLVTDSRFWTNTRTRMMPMRAAVK